MNHLCCCFQDTDENGKTGGEIEVPLHMVAKGEVPAGLNGCSAHVEV